MSSRWVQKLVGQIFEVRTGDYHARSELDPGPIPLISCGDTNNGLVGFFNIPHHNTYQRSITVAYNGQPLTAKFHPYRFGAKDDVAVLIPRLELRDTTLLYMAAMLNRMTWRYSYGRKCFQKKFTRISISVPITEVSGEETVDENRIEKIFPHDYRDFIPERKESGVIEVPPIRWARFALPEIFDFSRGDFNSFGDLDPGPYMTVSRESENNGVVGYFAPPEGATIYPRGVITVSTTSGDAFVQLDEFIASDKVVICIPKIQMRITSLFFLAFVLTHQRWRYSYGRSCFARTLAQASVYLPVSSDGGLDHDTMESVVQQASYWRRIERRFESDKGYHAT